MARQKLSRSKRNAKGELIFVYNVDTGFVNDFVSSLQRFLQPQNHQCQLIYLTWGIFGIKAEWERYVERLPYSTFFVHRDVFVAQFPHRKFHPLPAIFLKQDGSLYQVMGQADLLEIVSLPQLEKKLKQQLDEFQFTPQK